jgi:hypothetical protein
MMTQTIQLTQVTEVKNIRFMRQEEKIILNNSSGN